MTVYTYASIAVYSELGGALRLAKGARAFTTDPTTGAPVDATQGARVAPYVDADAAGDVTFTAESWPVRLTVGATYEDVWPIDAAGPVDATVAGLVGAATATQAALDARYLMSVPPLFADPGADALAFWDDSVGAFAALTASTGLTLTGTDLTVRSATDALMGGVELATPTETVTGTDTVRATTPAGVKAVTDGLGGGGYTNGAASVGPLSASTTLVDSPVITADGTKRYKISAFVRTITGTVATDVFAMTVTEVNSGTNVSGVVDVIFVSTTLGVYAGNVSIAVPDTPAVGARQYRLSASRGAGTGTATFYSPKIIVEQIR